jgi:large subunit ribosomal protein L15
MGLHNLKPANNSRKKPVRVGRGRSAGKGKTCGRGNKGQRARSGKGKIHRAFEGGQMPLARRVPKRGFKNIFRIEYNIVNVGDLNRFEKGTTVGEQELRGSGMARKKNRPIKILGGGELEKKLEVYAHQFSSSARKKIEQAGGKAEVI